MTTLPDGRKVINLTADPYALNSAMEFDHVIVSYGDNTVSDDPTGKHAPTVYDRELSGEGWTFMGGNYTGQQGGGYFMHDSEFVGGRLALDILAQPGYYVAVACEWPCDREDCTDECDNTEGWIIAFRPLETPETDK